LGNGLPIIPPIVGPNDKPKAITTHKTVTMIIAIKLCNMVLITFFTYHSTVEKPRPGVMINTSAVATIIHAVSPVSNFTATAGAGLSIMK
jgi:hypothetical protein